MTGRRFPRGAAAGRHTLVQARCIPPRELIDTPRVILELRLCKSRADVLYGGSAPVPSLPLPPAILMCLSPWVSFPV